MMNQIVNKKSYNVSIDSIDQLKEPLRDLEEKVRNNIESESTEPLNSIFQDFTKILKNCKSTKIDLCLHAFRLLSHLKATKLTGRAEKRCALAKAAHLFLELGRYKQDFSPSDYARMITDRVDQFTKDAKPNEVLFRFELRRCSQTLFLEKEMKSFFDTLFASGFISDDKFVKLNDLQKILYFEWGVRLSIIKQSDQFSQARYQALNRFNEGFTTLNDKTALQEVLMVMQVNEKEPIVLDLIKEIQTSLGGLQKEDQIVNFENPKARLEEMLTQSESHQTNNLIG